MFFNRRRIKFTLLNKFESVLLPFLFITNIRLPTIVGGNKQVKRMLKFIFDAFSSFDY